jgi:shikimate kinase
MEGGSTAGETIPINGMNGSITGMGPSYVEVFSTQKRCYSNLSDALEKDVK